MSKRAPNLSKPVLFHRQLLFKNTKQEKMPGLKNKKVQNDEKWKRCFKGLH